MRIRYWKLAVTAAACSVLGGNAAMAQQRTAPVAAPAVKPVSYNTTTTTSYYYQEGETPDPSAAAPAAPADEQRPVYYYQPVAAAAAEEEEESPWSFSGWLNASSNWNPANPRTSQNGVNTFAYRSNELMMNQLYMIGQRASNSDPDAFGVGGRVDLLYGTDWQFTYARGLEVKNNFENKWNGDYGGGFNDTYSMYGLAMPQAYLEFYAPIFGGVTTKVGHYYTLIGYEVVTAPDNFFITHNYSMQYGEPFTHTGWQSSVQVTENVAAVAGMNRGWDTWEDGNNDWSFTGMLTYTNPTFGGSLAVAYQGGPEGNEFPNAAPGATSGWRNCTSIVYVQPVTESLRYVFHSDVANDNTGSVTPNTSEWYSATQYLFLDLTEKYSVGIRTGWFRDDDGVRIFSNPANGAVGGPGVAGNSVGMAGNYWDLSLGNNYKVTDNFILRGETRYTWSDAKGIDPDNGDVVRPYDDGARGSQLQMSGDIIVRF